MKKIIQIGIFAFLFISNCFSQETNIDSNLNDGPYIFIESNQLIQKTVLNGQIVTEVLDEKAFDTLFQPKNSIYKDVASIAALSDIHGQYDLAVEILVNNKIIDNDLNWSFGDGHLVIVGDVFDRGPKVTEMLWLIFNIEKQAENEGGKVHFLLGNHEFMVLQKDLRYLHEKYSSVAKLFNMDYDELFGKQTVLGRWLRSKNTIVKIYDHTFVHGGISQDFLSNIKYDLVKINATMRTSIDRTKAEMKSAKFYTTYFGSSGPVWYRGYFEDKLKVKTIDKILAKIRSNHIVVGHCSNETVVSLFDKRIFGVDSSIKKGKDGELLLILDGNYFRGTKDGERIPL